MPEINGARINLLWVFDAYDLLLSPGFSCGGLLLLEGM
jgi:hypothetical protein